MANIISWNVNGIRAVHRKGALNEIFDSKPDILCLQESKATEEQIRKEIGDFTGYNFYSQSPTLKKGYSGVVIYSKTIPDRVSHETGSGWKDEEGRIIMAEYKDFFGKGEGFTLINCYFPNGGGTPERLEYKLDFYNRFLTFLNKLHMKQPNILICGDFNVAHRPIDLARPKENETHVGFLPIERAWVDKITSKNSGGWVDVFRHFYPNKAEIYTYWDMKTFARERNVGWRIDYFFSSPEMLKKIKSIEILSDVFGSDHCPIKLVLKN